MCPRRRVDLMLTGKIAAIHRRSRDTYGSPNIHAELADDHGIRVGRKRVARLMRQNGIRGATLRKYVVTTQSDPQAPKPIDLVERRFFADAPDQLWVADMTYIPTWSGWLYLAMALALALALWGFGKNFLRIMLGSQLTLPDFVWHRLTVAWVLYCVFMAVLNGYVAAFYSTDAWANFKLWGYVFPVAFIVGQGIYVARHIKDEPAAETPPGGST